MGKRRDISRLKRKAMQGEHFKDMPLGKALGHFKGKAKGKATGHLKEWSNE